MKKSTFGRKTNNYQMNPTLVRHYIRLAIKQANTTPLSSKGARWRLPTESELANEFLSEPSLREYYGIQFSWATKDPNEIMGAPFQLFLKTLKDVSKVVTFTSLPKGIEFHEARTLEELKDKISHMGKDIDSLSNAMYSGQPLPYPILIHKSSGLEMIGGRTRFGIANILNLPVQALVIDETRLKEVVGDFIYKKFIFDPESPFLKGITEQNRKRVLSWALSGSKNNTPSNVFESDTPAFMVDIMLESWFDMIQKALSLYGRPRLA
jgi:hypothetical protein